MTPDLPATETAVVQMTNDFRAAQGRSAVKRNATLDKVARSFARYLARSGKFSHTADGRKPAERARSGGYAFCQIAENLALNLDSRGFATRQLARQAINGWKNSPGHRRNMLARHVTEIGVGIAKAPGEPKYLSVQLFGRPQALSYSYTIRNQTEEAVTYAVNGKSNTLTPRTIVTHTTCRPHSIRFSFSHPDKAFLAGRDDTFVVDRAPSGRLIARQRPRIDASAR